jgi:uncharacterized protein (DUF433 family)
VEQAVVRDPEIMHGAPVFRGTRVPVQTLFDYLEDGETLEDFLEGFPPVTRDLAFQALEEANQFLLSRLMRVLIDEYLDERGRFGRYSAGSCRWNFIAHSGCGVYSM